MRFFFLALLLIFALASGASLRKNGFGDPEQPYYKATLIDHFSGDSDTFQQKYYVNGTSWDGNGPVFFYLGNEGGLTGPPQFGYLLDLAERHNALLVSCEHRFYGDSVPNGDMSSENLKFLTVDQALADYADFITYFASSIGDKNQDNHPWFVFGRSYGGALSSWFRIKYPDLSKGSLSSSGVVNSILWFDEFDTNVHDVIPASCANKLKAINLAFEALNYADNHNSYLFVRRQMGAPDRLWSPDLFYMIADAWTMAVQYGEKDNLCSAMEAIPSDASHHELVTYYSDWVKGYYGEDFGLSCFYNTMCLRDYEFNPYYTTNDDRSWRWQKCYELAYFQTRPRGEPLNALRSQVLTQNYMLSQCENIFGENVLPPTPSTEDINTKYGGANPQGHNIFYSDFSDDPWRSASVLSSPSEDQPFFFTDCNGCGHCQDFATPSETDPAPLKACRQTFESYLDEWLYN
jgi:pimeloyl-ACP methyl ester carboxylesterase